MSEPADLLAAPFATGALAWPERLAVLRARPCAALPAGILLAEQGFRPLHDALAAQGVRVWPELPPDLRDLPAAAVLATRSRDETRALFARAWSLAAPGAPVLAAGAKTDGIESLQKAVRRLLPLAGVLPRGHGRVFWTLRDRPDPPEFAAWRAEAAPAPRVVLPDGARMTTVAGAFSWREADPGSLFLASRLPPLSGRVADLGAGWGHLSHEILKSPAVAALDLVEADHAALACARANVTDPRAAFLWDDARAPGLPRGGHDWVIANPPFHQSRAAEPALGEAFVAAAARLLRPGGTLLLVANRALPYERALAAAFVETERLDETQAYKILRGFRPRRGAAGGR